MTAGTVSAPATAVPRRHGCRGRFVVGLLDVLAAILLRLPDRPLHRLAHALGGALYLLQPRRRVLVRANLGRVCRWLVEHELATPAVAAAARDERALARLVRAAFGHYLRSYLEGILVERYARPDLAGRIEADDPALVEACFGPAGETPRSAIFVGLHFGAIEIPALWAARRGMSLTSPMETLADPYLQAFLVRRRGASRLRLIPTAGARRELRERLAAGESVALVADRLVGGSGTRVELFGAPARLPLGPAVLALESGVPAWAVGVRRTGAGEYRARLEPIALPATGTRRERLAGFLEQEARTFERIVADAPEQWWTLFFPLWRSEGR